MRIGRGRMDALVTNLFKQSSPQPRSRPPGERVHHHERQRSHLFGHPPQCVERPLMQRPAVSPAATARAPAVAGSGRGLPVGRLLRVVNPSAAPTVIPARDTGRVVLARLQNWFVTTIIFGKSPD